jgi:co-chaperonin GroES (HSP10)
MMSLTEDAALEQLTDDMGYFFPEVSAGMTPFGSRILVQIRGVKEKLNPFIYVPEKTQEIQRDNTQVAKVIAVGPLAYKSRDTMMPWPEGAWCKPGDFVWLPKYGGDRFEVSLPKPLHHAKYGKVDKVQFAIFDDLNILTHVPDPLVMPFFLGA